MEVGSCSPPRLVCISCNLFVVGVILFDFTILVCLFSIQALQSSFTLSMFSSIALLMGEGLSEFESNSSLELEEWRSSTGPVISSRSILFTNLETWITLALLAWPS